MHNNNKRPFDDWMFSDKLGDESGELIQILEPGDEEALKPEDIPDEMPILPVRNTVLFPGVVIPVTVGRSKSIKLVKKAYNGDRIIGVVAQTNSNNEEPSSSDLYKTGTIARILKMLVLPDGNTTIIIQGKNRFEISEVVKETPYMTARIRLLEEYFPKESNKKLQALIASLKESASNLLRLNPDIPQEAQVALDNIENASFLTHFLSSNVNVEVADKQKLLEINDGIKRAELLLQFMLKDIQMLELKQEIHNKVHSDIDQQQRDYFLRQQMKVLQDELGQEGPDQEVNALREKAKGKNWPVEVLEHFNKELDKISRM
ncbi:MAG: LON peptidase substrate-binding domain-containing protein, partial [Bacteroidota bacterium]